MLTNPTARALWLAIAVIAGAVVGTAGGLLGWAGGMNPPTAILTGGGTFAGTVLFILTVLRFATEPGD